MSQEEKTTAPAAGSPAPGPQPEGTAQEKLEALAEEARSLLRSEDSQREDTLEGKVTWRSFVSGEILLNPAFRRQIPLLIVILLFTIVYIDNRFAVQQQIIEIDRKEKALTEMKYIALTRSSELTEMTRQSRIEEAINAYQSELTTATNPPYLIRENPEEAPATPAPAAPAAENTQRAPEKAQHFSEKAQALPEKSDSTTEKTMSHAGRRSQI